MQRCYGLLVDKHDINKYPLLLMYVQPYTIGFKKNNLTAVIIMCNVTLTGFQYSDNTGLDK